MQAHSSHQRPASAESSCTADGRLAITTRRLALIFHPACLGGMHCKRAKQPERLTVLRPHSSAAAGAVASRPTMPPAPGGSTSSSTKLGRTCSEMLSGFDFLSDHAADWLLAHVPARMEKAHMQLWFQNRHACALPTATRRCPPMLLRLLWLCVGRMLCVVAMSAHARLVAGTHAAQSALLH